MKLFNVMFCFSFGTIFLAGCVQILPEDPEPSKKIVLRTQLTRAFEPNKALGSLVIDRPLMLESLDSKRLKIVFHDEMGVASSDVVAGVEWSDKLPALLQETLMTLYEKTGQFAAVGKGEENFQAPYRLKITLTHFEIIKEGNSSLSIHVGFSAKIIQATSQKVVSQQKFSQKISIIDEKLPEIMTSLEKATSASFSDLIQWTVERLKAEKA